MPNNNDIQSFILRDVFNDTPADKNLNYRPTEIESKTFDAEATLGEFDYIDGKGNDGHLYDAERHDEKVDRTGTQGTKIVLDNTEYFVQSMWIADVSITFSNGHTITAEEGLRIFVLGKSDPDMLTGDIILSPSSTARDKIYLYLDKNPGVTLTSITVDKIRDDLPLDKTNLASVENFIPCFVAGTLIETPAGAVPIDNLKVGDMVATLDNGYQPIRWIGSSPVSARKQAANPKLCPVRIDTGALGDGRPTMPLMVSRQHRMVIKSEWAYELFGTEEVLVPAIKLVDLPGIEIAYEGDVVYYHILLDSHEILTGNGVHSESLYLGEQALLAVSAEAREEITALFPEVVNGTIPAPQSRPFVERKRDVRQVLGHKKPNRIQADHRRIVGRPSREIGRARLTVKGRDNISSPPSEHAGGSLPHPKPRNEGHP